MWIMLNNAFLSVVVAPQESLKRAGIDGDAGDWLSVRARSPEHISRVFPTAAILTWPGRDYRARSFVPRRDVEAAMVEQVRRIDYTNFKDSVDDGPLHDAYLDVWSAMWSYQQGLLELAEGNEHAT